MAKKKSKPVVGVGPGVPGGDYGTFHLEVNGVVIDGVKQGGRWAFTSESFPDIAKSHTGDETIEGVMASFLVRAGAFTIEVKGE